MQVHAEEPQLAELGEHLLGEFRPLEPPVDLGEHPFADPVPHRVADHPLLVRKERIEIEEVDWVEFAGRHTAVTLYALPHSG